MENDTAIDASAAAERSGLAALPRDLSRYRAELADMQLSESQEHELLQALWGIMRGFVELGFDVGAADIWGSIASDDFQAASAPIDSGMNKPSEEADNGEQ